MKIVYEGLLESSTAGELVDEVKRCFPIGDYRCIPLCDGEWAFVRFVRITIETGETGKVVGEKKVEGKR